MSVGDVNSNERGSGARYNDGKPPLELIPLRVIAKQFEKCLSPQLFGALWNLALFQEGGDIQCLHDAIECVGADWEECAAVLAYGRKKYAEWNWCKGMPWSVPLGCAARHLVLGMIRYEPHDAESGLSHRGHFICNLMMLITFTRTYPEGDDRPSKWLQERSMSEHASREDDARLIAKSNAEAD